MAKKNYYAVRKGYIPGIYKTWDECKAQTDGYPGAEYKGFATEPEAKDYMNGITPSPSSPQKKPQQTIQSNDSNTAIAYVDGSYDDTTKHYSYGCIIQHQNQEIELSKAFNDTQQAKMRNVAGEIAGALAAMEWCVSKHINHLHLYYDYKGIEMWCTGEWQAKNTYTKEYKKQYDRYTTKSNLTVTFHKVQAHTGDLYNEKVDKLAKKALGI